MKSNIIITVIGVVAAIITIYSFFYDKAQTSSTPTNTYTECSRDYGKAMVRSGNSKLSTDNLIGAERDFQKALDCVSKIDDRYGIAAATLGLAKLALKRGNLSSAESLAQRGLSQARSSGSTPSLAYANMVLGDIAARRGNKYSACTYWNECLRLLNTAPPDHPQDVPKGKMMERLIHFRCL